MELLMTDTKIDFHTQSIIVAPTSHPTIYRLGIDIDAEGKLLGDRAVLWGWVVSNARKIEGEPQEGLEWLNMALPEGVMARPSVTLRIGARMGKPEGSNPREIYFRAGTCTILHQEEHRLSGAYFQFAYQVFD